MSRLALILAVILSIVCGQAFAANLMGELIEVRDDIVVAQFPAQVRSSSMITILSGKGESIAGMAISAKCEGDCPYKVTGRLLFVSDAEAITAGKKVYVNSVNTLPAPSSIVSTPCPAPMGTETTTDINDLRAYYFAAAQNVGYGVLGIGYDRTLNLSNKLGIELDGGITTLGNFNSDEFDWFNTDQFIGSFTGRAKYTLDQDIGLYAGYRWSKAQGDQTDWNNLVDNLLNNGFSPYGIADTQKITLQGWEYGIILGPTEKFSLSLGYIPEYRADMVDFGTTTERGYTAEIRLNHRNNVLRLRGIKSEDFWQADLSYTLW